MLTKPASCDGCPVAHRNVGFAFGDGPTTSKVMLVGEALGEIEAHEGLPFVGGTGRMLRGMLHQAGFTYGQYYLTNIVKCRPPKNATPEQLEIDICTTRYLQQEIRTLKPNVIVAVGSTALKHLVPLCPAGVTDARGHVFESRYGKVIPIVHPSFVARGNPEYWAITVQDLKRVKQHSSSPDFRRPVYRFNISPSLQDVQAMANKIINENLPVSFDLETLGQDEQTNILCCGFAWSPSDALCVPFLRRGGYPYWRNDYEEEKAWEAICGIFDSQVLKITQNGFTFDLPVLMYLGVKFGLHSVVDTLVKHHVVATELPHSLGFLTSVYTDMEYYKGDVRSAGGMLWAPDETVRRYNLLDCIATYITNYALDKDLKDLDEMVLL